MDLILQIGASKLVLSFGLAAVAFLVQRSINRPHVSHLLWLLVLGTLLVPSVVSIPVPGIGEAPSIQATQTAATGAGDSLFAITPATIEAVKTGLLLLWILGAVVILGWSLVRTLRFHHAAVEASRLGSHKLQGLASELANTLGLAVAPTIHTTRAQLSPMVWWAGGTVRVLLPVALVSGMEPEEVRWILAHELAHVRRRDHVVRWIEWLACAAFWWNPVAWWARREMRASEELCCDALVLANFNPSPHRYANSLVNVIDFLSTPMTLRAPAFASEADGAGRTKLIERRIRMIVSRAGIPSTPGRLRTVLSMFVILVLPLGFVYCTDEATTALEPEISAEEVALDDANIELKFGESIPTKIEARYYEAKENVAIAVKLPPVPDMSLTATELDRAEVTVRVRELIPTKIEARYYEAKENVAIAVKLAPVPNVPLLNSDLNNAKVEVKVDESIPTNAGDRVH